MYEAIEKIIDHVWSTNSYSSSEQQIIYYICGSIIILLVIWTLDLIKSLINSAAGKR